MCRFKQCPAAFDRLTEQYFPLGQSELCRQSGAAVAALAAVIVANNPKASAVAATLIRTESCMDILL